MQDASRNQLSRRAVTNSIIVTGLVVHNGRGDVQRARHYAEVTRSELKY